MRHTLLLTLAVSATVVLAAQQTQEIRLVTADVQTMAPGRAGGPAPMARGSAVIFGTATEGDSNRPVSGAIATLTLPASQPLRVMTDSEGRFGFRDLPAGRFSITITKPGFVDGAYGRTRPRGPTQPLGLQNDEKLSGVTIPLWRFAAITGMVVDESGDPIVGIPVRALRRTIQSGKTQLVPGPQDTTDDRGIYRLGGLEPAEYVVVVPMQRGHTEMITGPAMDRMMRVEAEVMAVRGVVLAGGGGDMGAFYFFNAAGPGPAAGLSADGRPLGYPTVFYPSAASASRAQVIPVTSGEERAAVDFQLRGTPTVTVSGTAMGPNGAAPNLQITLAPAEADGLVTSIETITGFSDGQGRFTIAGVPSGQYVLRAVLNPRPTGPMETTTVTQGGAVMTMRMIGGPAPLPTEPTYWTEMALPVGDDDVRDLTISLRPGAKVTGMVQFDGAAQRPEPQALASIPIMLEPAEVRPGLTPGRGRIEATGQFATMGVPAGRYFLRVPGAPRGWHFQSAMVGGRDASLVPIELDSDLSGVMITFTDRPSELTGQVDTGGVDEAVSVLVFPADRDLWVGYGSVPRQLVAARADRDGKYSFQNLPPGEYFVAAVPDKVANEWQDPRVLERLASAATRVRIQNGVKTDQQVKVIR